MFQANQVKAILYHKHHASARTQFLKHAYGGVIAMEALPKLAHLEENQGVELSRSLEKRFLEQVAIDYGVQLDELVVDEEFDAIVDVPGEKIPVLLVRFKTIDPPFDEAEKLGGRFINLTEARGLPDVELLLLQSAYKVIMEG